MTRWLRDRLRRRANGERGVAVVEMAIIAPVLILLVIGAVEFGLAFMDRHTVSGASNSAARTGGTAGQDAYADIAILDALVAGFGATFDPTKLTQVEVYRGDGSGGKDTSNVNTYLYVGGPCPWQPCPDPDVSGWAYGGPWVPSTRDTTLDSDGLDTLGIELTYNHYWISGVLGTGPQTWIEDTQIRLEPDTFGSSP